METILYTCIEDLKKIIAQAENEASDINHLGLVRIPLKEVDGVMNIKFESYLMNRVLIS